MPDQRPPQPTPRIAARIRAWHRAGIPVAVEGFDGVGFDIYGEADVISTPALLLIGRLL